MMFVKRILKLLIILVTSSLCSPIIADTEGNVNDYIYDDWICDASKNRVCKGYYLEQPVPFPGQLQKNLESQPISITSDQGQFVPEGNSILNGHVHLIQGNRQSFADQVIIHRDPNKENTFDFIQAIGGVKIIEPGIRVDGTKADIYVDQNVDIIQNAHYRLYDRHARGMADSITLRDKNRMVLKNATYTTCAPLQNTWGLKAENLDLNKKTGRGRARHARLYVKDVPVLYLPYIDFPIDDRRQTGFLYPDFGSTNRSGAEFAVPFYWNIAPNYDATITPRYLSKRGAEVQGLFRYLSYNSRGEIEGGILPNDRAYRQFLTEKRAKVALLNPKDPANALQLKDPRITALNKGNTTRTALRAQHATAFNPNWSTALQYQTVSDDNYFMDLGDTLGIASTTQLLQQADVTYQDPYWKVVSRLQQYQTLHPFDGPQTADVYRRLPQLSLQNSFLDLPGGLEWTTSGEFSRFLHKHDPFTHNPFTTGDRLQLRPGLALPFTAPGWFIKPRVQWNVWGYSLSLSPFDSIIRQSTNPVRAVPMLDLDSGLIFERNFAFKGEPFIQTLEPRAYYLYVPFRDQTQLPIFDTSYPGFDYNQLFRDNRFSGLDRVGDANQFTLSVSSRFLSEQTGDEQLSLTLGQILYLNERRVGLCNSRVNPLCLNQEFPNRKRHSSSYVGLARLYLHEHWWASSEVEWDPYKKRRDKEAFGIQYRPSDRTVLNLGYQFLRRNPAKIDPITGLPDRLEQTDTSLALAVTEKWRLLGRWHYDIKNSRSNDISLGIEQQSCCTAIRLYVSRFLVPYDNNNTIINTNNHSNSANNPAIFSHNRYSNAIFLQFIFKGFATVDNSDMSSTLKRSIPGYQSHDERF